MIGVNPDTGEDEERRAADDAPFTALAFKIMTDPYVGALTFLRVYSGVDELRLVRLQLGQGQEGAHRPPAQDARQQARGDQGGLRRRHRRAVGLRDTTTGDTLCDENKPIVLERMEFPDPVISIAIEPKTKADQEKLGGALQQLATEDPSFRVSDQSARPARRSSPGMGELHLEIIVDRLLREFKVDANVGKPQVAYKETIRKAAEHESRFIRQTGGHGQYGARRAEDRAGEAGRGLLVRRRHQGWRRFRASSSPRSRRA